MQRKQRPETIQSTQSINRTKITRKQKWEEKQLYGYFKRQTSEISHEKTWTWLRKENLKRERNKIADLDYVVIKTKCNKLAQKEYKTRYNSVGKVIHRELCKKFEFDHTNKWYMHNPESVQEKDTHKLLKDFEIQTNHSILAGQPDVVNNNNNKKRENLRIVDSVVPTEHRVKLKESEKRDKYQELTRELKKQTTEHEGDGDTSCNRCTWINPQMTDKWTRRLKNQRTSGDHPDYSIIKIGQNTEKSPEDLRRICCSNSKKK